MSEILICNQSMRTEVLRSSCGINPKFIHGNTCSNPASLSAFTPYVFGEKLSRLDSQIISTLSSSKIANSLTNLLLSFGGDNTVSLAEMFSKFHEYNIGMIGASTDVYIDRLGGFSGAVKKYQDALMAYREVINSNAASKAIAKQKVLKAFDNLQLRFSNELAVVNAGTKARRSTPLSSATRASNIARSSRNVAKLHVTSQAQAHNMVKFTQHAKLLGNGLAVIDFTSRVGNVHNKYKTGGEWERELFIEASSFAAGAIAGSIAVKGGLGLLMVATPVGWVGLIAGGAAVAGAAAVTSIVTNRTVKEDAGSLYDSIMHWLTTL